MSNLKKSSKTSDNVTADSFSSSDEIKDNSSANTSSSNGSSSTQGINILSSIHEKVREHAENSIEQIRTNYSKFKENAEIATDKLDASVATAQNNVKDFCSRILESIRSQNEASFKFAQSLLGVSNINDAMSLQKSFVTSQAQHLQSTAQELSEITRKANAEIAEHVKDAFSFAKK